MPKMIPRRGVAAEISNVSARTIKNISPFKVSPARSKPGRAVRSEGMPPGCIPVVHLVVEVAAEGGTYTVTGRESPGKSDVVFSAAVDRTGKAADALFC